MYLSPTPESIAMLMAHDPSEPVSMLNLLRFREIADYSESPDLAPQEPISGEQAYDIYVQHVVPLLRAVGGKATFSARGGPLLIGPAKARWDRVLIVEYPSIQAFFDLTQNPEYLSRAGHRTAALADSRLLPMT